MAEHRTIWDENAWWTTCDPGEGRMFFTDEWETEQGAREALKTFCETGVCLSGAVYPPSGDAVCVITTTITIHIHETGDTQ